MPPTSVRCPACSHILLTIDLPQVQAVAQGPSHQPDTPLLLRISEAARFLAEQVEGAISSGVSCDDDLLADLVSRVRTKP